MLATLGLPLLLLPLISTVILCFTRGVRETHHFPNGQAWLYWLTHAVLFVAGIFLVDFADSNDSNVSVASVYLGKTFVGFSMIIGYSLALVGVGLLIACFISACLALRKDRQNGRAADRANERSGSLPPSV